MKSPAEAYFAALAEIRATGGGVKETSYYPALINLLDAVGETLKPRVRAVSQLKNTERVSMPPPSNRPVSPYFRRIP